jgi:N-methylhydantoinase A/oxoprolinase/acetone carboxylase beta subunit
MVEAVDVHTTGLGGDSHVRLDGSGNLPIGPRRVVPLCLLASEHPGVTAELDRQVAAQEKDADSGQFALLWRKPADWLPDEDRALLRQLKTGPRPHTALLGGQRHRWLARRRLADLEGQLVVQRAAFTPTDALHVLGLFERWDSQASRLGAQLLAERAGLSPQSLCEQVVRKVADRLATELVSKVLEDEVGSLDWDREPSATALVQRAVHGPGDGDLDCRLTLRRPLVAIGAPVEAYMPGAAKSLNAELIIPTHAEVANAVGAVSGPVLQRLRVLIRPIDGDDGFRVHLPDGVRDFEDLEEAVLHTREAMSSRVRMMAQQAGAAQAEVRITRHDRRAQVGGGWGEVVYLGTELVFTAVGRPSAAHPSSVVGTI